MALRVFYGQVPHRDFYHQYGPFAPYAYSTLFRLFGVSLLPVMLLEQVIRAATVAAAYNLLRQATTQTLALLGAAMVAALTCYSLPSSGQDAVCMALVCGIVAAPVLARRPSAVSGAVYGLACGGVTLFRYEQGVTLLALYAALMGARLLLRRGEGTRALRDAAMGLLGGLASYGLVAAALLLWLWHGGAVADFHYQVVTFAREHYYGARHMPFFPPVHRADFDQALVYLPLVVLPTAVAGMGWLFWRRRSALATQAGGVTLFLLLLTAAYTAKGLVRKDFVQLLPAILCACLLLCALFQMASVRWHRLGVGTLLLAAGVCSARFWKRTEQNARQQHLLVVQRWLHLNEAEGDRAWCSMVTPMTRGFCFYLDPDHRTIVTRLQAEGVTAGSPLFVGLPRHDVIYANDNLLYFAANTVPAVKWSLFDPDLENRADIQQEMIAGLSRKKPEFAVLTAVYAGHHEPNDSEISSHVFLLDRYIAEQYAPDERAGVLTLLRRKADR